jgi:hypothetical protein
MPDTPSLNISLDIVTEINYTALIDEKISKLSTNAPKDFKMGYKPLAKKIKT